MRPLMAGAAAAMTMLLGWAGTAGAQDGTPPADESATVAQGDPKKPPPPPPPKAPTGDKKTPPAPPPKKTPPPPPPVKKAPPPPPAKKAEPAPKPAEPQEPGSSFTEWERATEGLLGPTWKDLEEKGVTVEATYLNDYTRLQRGGVKPHNNADRYWFTLKTALDFEKMGGPEGLGATFAYWQMGGENGSLDAGAFNEISSFESDSRKELAEAFLEWSGWVRDMRLKVGKMDPTWEFTYSDVGDTFMNLGTSFPPNLLMTPNPGGIPVYPDPAFGGALFYEPEKGPYVSLGLFDGAAQEGKRTGERGWNTLIGDPSDLYGIVEVGYTWDKNDRPVRLAIGGWHHSGHFAEFDGGVDDDVEGFYSLVEGQLTKTDRDDPEDERGLWLLLRYTSADEAVTYVERHYAAAVVWKGVCAARKQDSIGLAYIHANLTDDAAAGLKHGEERVLEAYYRWQATKFLSIAPGFQHIWNPGGNYSDALVFGLRIAIDF